jgi:hypothetical protein
MYLRLTALCMRFSHPYKLNSAKTSFNSTKFFNHSEFTQILLLAGYVIINIITRLNMHNILFDTMDHTLFESLTYYAFIYESYRIFAVDKRKQFRFNCW